MKEQRRVHISQQIKRYGLGLDEETERWGTPHALVLTKKQQKQAVENAQKSLVQLQAIRGPQRNVSVPQVIPSNTNKGIKRRRVID